MIFLAPEDFVFCDADEHVQIAALSAALPRFAFAAGPGHGLSENRHPNSDGGGGGSCASAQKPLRLLLGGGSSGSSGGGVPAGEEVLSA